MPHDQKRWHVECARTPILLIIIIENSKRNDLISNEKWMRAPCTGTHTRTPKIMSHWIRRHRCCWCARGLAFWRKIHFVVISIVSRIESNRIALHRNRIDCNRARIFGNLSLNTIDTWMTGHMDATAIRDNFCRFQFNIKKYSVAAVRRCLLFLLRSPASRPQSFRVVRRPRIQLQLRVHRRMSDVVDNVNVAHYYRHFDAK